MVNKYSAALNAAISSVTWNTAKLICGHNPSSTKDLIKVNLNKLPFFQAPLSDPGVKVYTATVCRIA